MVDELISLFKKNDLERKMFLVYIKTAVLPVLLYIFLISYFKLEWFFNFMIYFVVLLFLEFVSIYGFMLSEIKSNDLGIKLKALDIKNNISKYSIYEKRMAKELVNRYLEINNICNCDKVLFLLESIRLRKKPKIQRDWFNTSVTISLTIIVAVTEGENVDAAKMLTLLYSISIVFLLYVIYLFVKGYIMKFSQFLRWIESKVYYQTFI